MGMQAKQKNSTEPFGQSGMKRVTSVSRGFSMLPTVKFEQQNKRTGMNSGDEQSFKSL